MIRIVFDRTNPEGVRAVLYENGAELATGELKPYVVEAAKDLRRALFDSATAPRKEIVAMLQSVITRHPERLR